MLDRRTLLAAAFSILASATIASAQCPPDCPIKGGGDAATDCHSELANGQVRLNAPFYNPEKPKPAKELRCFDGDPGCDLDGVVNNSCTFDIDLCLRNPDPSLPSCTAADVTAVTVAGKGSGFEALQTAVSALLPATTNDCTTGQTQVVPLKGPTGTGEFKAAKLSFKTSAATAGGTDEDSYKFVCVPHGWASHGFDAANTRETPLESKITPANVSTLQEKWTFVPPDNGPNGRTVTSTVTLGPKLLYTTSWNGRVYAVDKKSGKLKWTFATSSASQLGVQSSVTLAPDGRVVVGDSNGKVYCLDGKKGTLLWQANAGSEDPAAAHAWASPTVANNRVLMGIASHNDAPCTRGTLVAFDLDDGSELWRQYTVPERICYDDTTNECSQNSDCTTQGSPCLLGNCDSNPDIGCSTNDDCPGTFLEPGTCVGNGSSGECWLERSITCSSDAECPACVKGVGGGVTATPAVSADGNDVYMASVGCLSRPSIGYSDSIFKLDAATGTIDWAYRTEAVEQFQSFPGSPAYHDYGFLNGPILASTSDGMSGTQNLAVAGSKDGTLYAVDQETGDLVWSNVVTPAPTFAGFGLFNGAVAFEKSSERFFASLYTLSGYSSMSPRTLAFDGVDGSTEWATDNTQSWTSVTVANGMLFTAGLAAPTLTVRSTTDGSLLATLPVPAGNVLGGVAIDNGVLYVPYGQIAAGSSSQGGVRAFALPAE